MQVADKALAGNTLDVLRDEVLALQHIAMHCSARRSHSGCIRLLDVYEVNLCLGSTTTWPAHLPPYYCGYSVNHSIVHTSSTCRTPTASTWSWSCVRARCCPSSRELPRYLSRRDPLPAPHPLQGVTQAAGRGMRDVLCPRRMSPGSSSGCSVHRASLV